VDGNPFEVMIAEDQAEQTISHYNAMGITVIRLGEDEAAQPWQEPALSPRQPHRRAG
jgi:hypothetical protein